MIKIVRTLTDNAKQEILESADHKCQCSFGHRCITMVNKNSYFVTDSSNEGFNPETVKVYCKPCVEMKHHTHLTLPVFKEPKHNFNNK